MFYDCFTMETMEEGGDSKRVKMTLSLTLQNLSYPTGDEYQSQSAR
jgi:hypothetical protein